jgi:hypothetical protein
MIDKSSIDKIASRLSTYAEESRSITDADGRMDVQHKISFSLKDESGSELKIALISIAFILGVVAISIQFINKAQTPIQITNTK